MQWIGIGFLLLQWHFCQFSWFELRSVPFSLAACITLTLFIPFPMFPHLNVAVNLLQLSKPASIKRKKKNKYKSRETFIWQVQGEFHVKANAEATSTTTKAPFRLHILLFLPLMKVQVAAVATVMASSLPTSTLTCSTTRNTAQGAVEQQSRVFSTDRQTWPRRRQWQKHRIRCGSKQSLTSLPLLQLISGLGTL